MKKGLVKGPFSADRIWIGRRPTINGIQLHHDIEIKNLQPGLILPASTSPVSEPLLKSLSAIHTRSKPTFHPKAEPYSDTPDHPTHRRPTQSKDPTNDVHRCSIALDCHNEVFGSHKSSKPDHRVNATSGKATPRPRSTPASSKYGRRRSIHIAGFPSNSGYYDS